jgi:hypothetical protein
LKTILQIVPCVPGGLDGVGDYALTVAAKLRSETEFTTVFATSGISSATDVHGFRVLPLNQFASAEFDHAILHYVNYGYQKRGVPLGLLSVLRELRRQHRGKLLTVFHELYGSGPPWGSAFWLQPLQIHLTKSIARLSDECIVSNENFSADLQRRVPAAKIRLHPTPSGLEEPSLTNEQIAGRDPHQWVVVGGTVLAERSVRSFGRAFQSIPESITPHALFVLGGKENSATRSVLNTFKIKSDYRPQVSSTDASEILRTCSYMWIDYFHRPDVETSVALKSSAFAAACAHAVIPVFPHRGSPISVEGDRLPGPFFIVPNGSSVPGAQDRPKIAENIYEWYRRHSSSDRVVHAISSALGLVK